MTARLDETGLPPVNPLPHPTPVHIRNCISLHVCDDGGVDVYRVMMLVDAGINDACREHDKAQRP